MPRKSKKKEVKKYAGKTREEWRDWGEEFGKRMDRFGKKMEKRGKEFGEEIEDLAGRFGKHVERKGKRWEREWKGWWFSTFGFIGPLIGSVFGIVCIAFGIWVLNLINLSLGSNFILALSSFLLTNLYWFFAVFLFFGYSDYFSKRFPKTYWIVSPIISSLGVVIVIWISIWILNLINIFADSSVIAAVSNFLYVNLSGIFVVFLVLGYAIMFIKKFIECTLGVCE